MEKKDVKVRSTDPVGARPSEEVINASGHGTGAGAQLQLNEYEYLRHRDHEGNTWIAMGGSIACCCKFGGNIYSDIDWHKPEHRHF
ncbi:hypothetical protein PAAG_03848 [Paracoccidioides lutzii Pb01]|uniref:Uncharacterized protein n=1 Tax=Paracoccidioides lutzii (strain ATCC MYA-826 / Pb01) TaxID=502779 RepID=C1GZA4_PARBA|nr:hypothetical protein PAAG_03848 [Paracoccidioides lutzii Pb01]EEH41927.2 hypothetical protein PAAG_03848 [Paracoccidioides lutzii Pb01]